MTKFDAIVIGGGHNGLICATYLAQAGQNVCVLEANAQIGGAAVTEEFAKGFRVSSGAQFLNLLHPGIAQDLALESRGLKLAATDIPTTVLDRDGDHMSMRNGHLHGNVSEADAAAYGPFMDRLGEFAATLGHLIDLPPIDIFNPDRDDKKGALKLGWNMRFGLGREKMREMLRIIGMNVYDLIDEGFESDLLKAMLSLDTVLGMHAGPRSPGTVLNLLYRLSQGGRVAIPAGGMGGVTQAILRAAEAAGVQIRKNARVASVVVDNCRATGVVLDSGKTLNAGVIVSNADPKTTVFKLVGPRYFEADFVRGITHSRARGTTAKLHIALKDLPDFPGLDKDAMKGRLMIAESADAVERAFNHVKYGEVSDTPVMEFSIPTLVDTSLADEGHVLNATVQFAPYGLKGGWTKKAKKAFTVTCLDRLEAFAPGLRKLVKHSELLTPADIEARFGMTGGDWNHGEMALDQMLMLRPTPGAARYALPLDGLYLCGAGAHPGGGVMGAAGRNAAKAILKGATA